MCPTVGMDLINDFPRIAEEKWYSRLTKSAKTNFKEMGMVQLTICMFKNKSGKFTVNM